MVKKETVIETIKKVFFNYIESEPESLPEISNGYASPKVRVTVRGRKGELEVMCSLRLKDCDEEYWMIESGAVWKVLAWQPLTTPYVPPVQPSKFPQSWVERTMSGFERVE